MNTACITLDSVSEEKKEEGISPVELTSVLFLSGETVYSWQPLGKSARIAAHPLNMFGHSNSRHAWDKVKHFRRRAS